MSPCLLVGPLVSRFIVFSQKAGELHFHAPVRALVQLEKQEIGKKQNVFRFVFTIYLNLVCYSFNFGPSFFHPFIFRIPPLNHIRHISPAVLYQN